MKSLGGVFLTMRPEISEALAGDVDDRVRSEVRVPPDRLTFADRVRVLVEEYDERGEEIEALRDRVDDLEAALDDARDRVDELEDQTATSSPTTSGSTFNAANNW
jgi:predicted nuclease with TOPRIM domain